MRESLLETVLRNMRENGALNDGELRALRILAACDRREAARAAFEEGWHEHFLEWDRQRTDPSHPITKRNPYDDGAHEPLAPWERELLRSASPPREPHVDWPTGVMETP